MCNLINTHTHTHTHIHTIHTHTYPYSSIELVDYRAGLRGYVQFNKYTHTHTRNKYH